jgi:FMN phosphatase YigB (HAD superfamily)
MKTINSLLLCLPIRKIFIRYIAWDFDGTLWQDPALGNKIKSKYSEFIKKQSAHPYKEDEFDSLVEKFGSWGAAASKLTNVPKEKIIDWVEDSFDKTIYIKRDKKLVRTIEQLSDYKHFILTNSTKQQVEKGLKRIGFKNKGGLKFFPFEKIFCPETLRTLKPHPEAFKAISSYTGELPMRHLMVGDSLLEDIEPAHLFGFQAVHIDNIYNYLNI